jgi:hypothetical protein
MPLRLGWRWSGWRKRSAGAGTATCEVGASGLSPGSCGTGQGRVRSLSGVGLSFWIRAATSTATYLAAGSPASGLSFSSQPRGVPRMSSCAQTDCALTKRHVTSPEPSDVPCPGPVRRAFVVVLIGATLVAGHITLAAAAQAEREGLADNCYVEVQNVRTKAGKVTDVSVVECD